MDDDVPMESDGSVAAVGLGTSPALADVDGRGEDTDSNRGNSGGREVEMGRQTGDWSDDKTVAQEVEVGRSGKSERNERGMVRETRVVGKEERSSDDSNIGVSSRRCYIPRNM